MLRHELVFLPFEPLGLQYIQAVIMGKGHEVMLYDCLVSHPRKIKQIKEKGLFRCGSEEKNIKEVVKSFNPDIVGISGMFFAQAGPFNRIANLVKEIVPRAFVVGGGAYPSSYQKQALVDNPNIDAIVVGEGEVTMAKLIDNIDNLHLVSGIWYRIANTGEIVYTGSQTPIANLDNLPMPYRDTRKIYNYSKPVGYNYSDKFDFKKILKSSLLYGCLSVPGIRKIFTILFNFRHRNKKKALFMPHGFIVTSRSCPNRCTFCAIHKVWGSFYRMRSAKNILNEIDILAKAGVKEVVIVDDNFTVSKTRTIEICKEVIKRKYNLRFLTPSGVFIPSLDKEVLEYLYKAGFRELNFGIENGNQIFLKNNIKKDIDLNQAKRVIAQAKEIGFVTGAFFIFGYPGETKDTMLDTLRYAFESKLDSARFYIYQPFPSTEAYRVAQEMGALDKDFDLARLKVMTDKVQVETKDFSKIDVKNIHNLAYEIIKKKNYEKIKDKLPEILNWQSI